MAVGLGAKAYGSFKEESTWSTFVTSPTARDVFFKLTTDEIDVDMSTFESEALGSRTVSQMYDGERIVGGPLGIEVGFEGVLPWLLKHVLGGYDYTVNTPVSGANTHVFNPKQDLPPGLSMEIGVGGIPADDKVFRYAGTKVSAIELTLEQGKILTCKVELVSYDEDTNTTLGHTQLQAPSFAALKPIKFWYHSLLTVAGSTVTTCRSWTLRIDNKLARRFNLARTTSEPIPDAKREVTFKGVMEFVDLAHYNKYKNATDGSFVLFLSSGTDQIITGATPYTFNVAGNNARITAGRPKQTSAGILTMPIECQLYAPTGAEIQVTLVNGQTNCGADIL